MAFGIYECYFIILLIVTTVLCNEYCPKRCVCESVASKVKLHCGSQENPIKFIDEIDFGIIGPNIVKLNLSSNHITNISSIVRLPSLRKLDLSKNRISHIENGIFINTPELKQIDLSNNLLHTLKQSLFDHLVLLKQIDISSNPLSCDCDVLFIAEYLQNKSIKLLSNPKCTYPKTGKVQYIKKIKTSGHFSNECNLPIENDEIAIKIHPNEDQIVFEGDALHLGCFASGVPANLHESKDTINITWTLYEQNTNSKKKIFTNVDIENKYSTYTGVIDSSLKITKLSRNHTGVWQCQLFAHHLNNNHTRTINVIVISNVTKYCPVKVTTNNKGVYPWPKTIIGYTVDLPCQGNPSDNAIRAFYTCDKSAEWLNLNTTACPYISETTRILEQYSKVNLTLTKVNVYESALHLRKNYTNDVKLLKDKMDVVFIARTVQNYLEFLWNDQELGRVLTDIINNILSLPKMFIRDADAEDKSCAKFINSVEVVSEYLTAINRPFFATKEFRIKRDSFSGLTCTWYSDLNRAHPKIQCSNSEDTWQFVDEDKTMEARIQIPDINFQQFKQQNSLVSLLRLFMAMYSSNKFFPSHFGNRTDSYTSVIGAKLANTANETLTTPISIMMRLNENQDDTSPIAVRWDATLNKGHGGWSSTGCQETHLFQNLLVFQCNQFGYYSVLQKITTPNKNIPQIGTKFKVSHPAIYIGGFVLFTSLLVTIVTYLLCYSSIQMAKKAKHSLINTWIAVSLLCFMYTFGIYQTEDVKVCQSVGIIIHYFTLSTLLWMCVTVSNMYKRISKSENTVLTDDGLQLDQPVQKPILGLYLVGWGIALIVCGISGAVNMRDYASHSYCFLESIPALSALFVPVLILFVFILVFLLMIRCSLRSTEAITQLSEGTQGTENVDLDLLEPPTSGTASVKSSSTRSSMIEDSEHGPLTQLKAHLINLIFVILAWICAAFTASMPLKQLFAYEEDLFGILYALCVSAFGVFNLFFYCVARNDVRTQWSLARRWFKRKQICFRTRSVSDTNSRPLPPLNTNQTSVETQITSRSSSRSSSQPKSVSRQSNNMKAGADLNEPDAKPNVDLLVLHRQQYRSNNTVPVYELASLNTAEMFYNPHQSGVARKFFRKQRRHMMKHNNLGTRRRDGSVNSVKTNKSNSDVSSNIFGTSSKVNNTNIHVEQQIKENKPRNPNILSDNCSDSEMSSRLDIPVHQLMLSTKKNRPANNRKPKINTHQIQDIEEGQEKDMRTVSQQCSLEYSSETLSERVLTIEKDLDLDASIACSDFTDFKNDKESLGKIYVNPLDDLSFAQERRSRVSLKSSVSTSDVDELYAQLKPAEEQRCTKSRTLATLCADELTTTTSVNDNNGPDKSETTV